jgi:3-methyladenine DNA glycosylase AlkD
VADSNELIERLRTDLSAVAVADDAPAMEAYMKHRFPFLGVKAPARRTASRSVIAASRTEPIDDVVALAFALRAQPERELHYVASDLLAANASRLRPDHLGDLRTFITTDPWWDTVDALASPTVGTIVRGHPDTVQVMDRWVEDDDFWVARAALIHQLRFGKHTDAARLFEYSLRRAPDREFFIRKAIGWALRQYARTDPAAVRAFVDAHRDVLSPLTVREATKHLGAPSSGGGRDDPHSSCGRE